VLHRWGMGLVFLGVGAAALCLFLNPLWADIFSTALSPLFSLMMVLVSLMAWANGYKPACAFFLSLTVYFAGILVFALTSFGWAPANLMTLNGPALAFLALVLMLSLTLADRITLIREEKDQAYRDAILHKAIASIHQEENALMKIEIDRRTEAEANLTEAHHQEELARLKAEAAKETAEAATRLKDQFVSLVAHDVRTPFTFLLGMTNALEHLQDAPLNDEQKEVLGVISQRGNQFLRMVDELLSLNRLQTGQIIPQIETFNARELVDEVCLMKHFSEEKGVYLINMVDSGLLLSADRQLIYEVLQNLIANAIKFCNSGNTIHVFTPPGRPHCLAVHDNGIGIPPDFLPNLFNPAVKTSTPGTLGEPGTGLGLPLCHQMIAAHGGSLTVESNPNSGTTFFVDLAPLPEPSGGGPGQKTSPSHKQGAKNPGKTKAGAKKVKNQPDGNDNGGKKGAASRESG
ncbi:MAG: sensor histidine kinase, partial [Deltaproteobacteria bacterium]|nr:sensor histidine kinase [Deltaproteobacteria bacterium]